MKKSVLVSLCLFVLLALAACGPSEKPKQAGQAAAPPAPLVAPTSNDDAAWRQYLIEVVKRHMEGVANPPYMYYLPSKQDPEFDAKYQRQAEAVSGTVARSVLPGNMLAFGSPESAKMADLIIEAFGYAPAGSFKDVRVLFIGKPEDSDRVRAAVEPSGAQYIFVEMK